MSGPSSEQLREHMIVRAGAGAGKTRRLTHQVIDTAREFLNREKRLPRMIVTTFTRKATQELRERLMLKALSDDPDMIDFVNSRSHLVVSTIHGVLDLYLKRYGGNVNLDPGYTVMGISEVERVARQVLRQIIVGNEKYQPLLEVYGFSRLVQLACKFHELILRDANVQPHSLSTFASLFAEEVVRMAQRADEVASRILAEATKEDWLDMARTLARTAKNLHQVVEISDDRGGAEIDAASANGRLATEQTTEQTSDAIEKRWSESREVILGEISAIKTARWNAKNPPVSDEANATAKEVLKELRELEDEIFDPLVWRDLTITFALFDEVGREFSVQFSKQKVRLGSIEISDLELLAMDCVRRFPETASSFAEEWDYWLIDEYQDTSPFQVELLRKLSGERPTFIVGDPQQSIYLFRGARSEVFSRQEAEILARGGAQDFLRKNYRSRPELLLFFNELFGKLDSPFQPMEPNIPDDSPMNTTRTVARFFIAPAATKSDANQSANNKPEKHGEAEVSLSQVSREEPVDIEMQSLVRHVQSLLAGGAAPEDICVLARTNRTLLDVAEWLGRFHLPTHVHAASGFYSRREILDALALLKFLVNPSDDANTVELLRSPWFRVPDDDLVRMIAKTTARSHWERLTQSSASLASPQNEAIFRLQVWLERRDELGTTETFRQALVEAGFIDLSYVHDRSGRRESNLWKLLAKLATEERRPGFNYLDFIAGAQLDLRESSGAEESDAIATVEPNRINLMTIHASKGLQFEHVILPRMEQAPRLTRSEDFTFDETRGLWAMRVPRGDALEMTASLAERAWLDVFCRQELEEHARVLYVALTRAVNSVFLSWTGVPKKNSWADMLRWDLTAGLHSNDSYTYEVVHGDINNLDLLPVPSRVSEHAALEPRIAWQRPVLALDVNADSAGDVSADRLKQNLSVSQLLDRSAPAVRSWETLALPSRLRLASEGSAVHRLMEALKCPSSGAIKNMIQRWFPGKEEKILAAIQFVTTIQEPPLAEVIRRGFVEWGFAFLENGTLIEGQVDLWGRIAEDSKRATVWVIDYKTGNPEGREKAFHQLGLYALALRKAGEVKPGDHVRLAAVYPFTEDVFIEEEPPATWYAERLSF